MMKMLEPAVLNTKGLFMYDPSVRSYARLKLDKVILKFFGMHHVREKRFSYKLEAYGYNYGQFKKKMDEIMAEGKMLPILFYIYEGEENEDNQN